jgi:CBS domain-containing protein
MTCKEIMTADPACCVPGDSVALAAQIMKRNDVGPVPVVSDQNEKRLVGIVTDRDLTLKVLAEGRDPHTTRVDEVMSLSPISCREDENTHRALQLMANHQVRRIPIVDANNRLSGIVAQADLALHEDEEDVGRVVEHISEPYGSGGWTEGAPQRSGSWPGASTGSLAMGALFMGIGAGLMYILSPGRKQHSESYAERDRGASYYSGSGRPGL